jgi:hypothetical protein
MVMGGAVRKSTGICTESPSLCRREKEEMEDAYTYILLVMQSVTRVVDGEAVTRSMFFATETWIAACSESCGVCRFRKAYGMSASV